ncbi:MAG TPA: HAMP domain-containing sensor histidine kinase [Vicinamibacterales bacterium]
MSWLFRSRADLSAYRSLAGRVAIGYLILIGIVLAAQGAVFVWLIDRADSATDSGMTKELGASLSQSLQVNPTIDLNQWIADLHTREHVFIIMGDGRTVGSKAPSESTRRVVIEELRGEFNVETMLESWKRSNYRAVPVMVDGHIVGALGITPLTTIERFGRQIVSIGIALLVLGTLVSSIVIIGPVQRRIRDLQRVARALGEGDVDARAVEGGGDEVAELASTFNSMADELAMRADELATSDGARRQLIADVSHELMTPLTAILGHLETLTMAEVRGDDQRLHRAVEVSTREAQRLERLIGELLDVARLEAGGGDVQIKPVAVSELFEQVIAHHEHESHTRRIRFLSSVASDAGFLLGDPFRLEQALENVTANAVRHVDDGGVIELRAESIDSTRVLTVSDSGHGIDPEQLPFIFDRFYKVASAKGVASRGSGLGLSIVKAIVMRHGGRVSASSALGRGTTIRIELPDHYAEQTA